MLGLFGSADQAIPPEAVEAFREALDAAEVPNEIVTYEGAPHSFFDRSFAEHQDACDDAWRRILRFVRGAEVNMARPRRSALHEHPAPGS